MAKFSKGQKVRIAHTFQYGIVTDFFEDGDNTKYAVFTDGIIREYSQKELRDTLRADFVSLVNYLFLDMDSKEGHCRGLVSTAITALTVGFFLSKLLNIIL